MELHADGELVEPVHGLRAVGLGRVHDNEDQQLVPRNCGVHVHDGRDEHDGGG
jgi:hypothetical protein